MMRFRFVLVVRCTLLEVEQDLPLDSFTDDEVEVAFVLGIYRNGDTIGRRDLNNAPFDMDRCINELDCFIKAIDWTVGADVGATWVGVVGDELVHPFRIFSQKSPALRHCTVY